MIRRLDNGNLVVPFYSLDDGDHADGGLEITPDHPNYAKYHAAALRYEALLEQARAIRTARSAKPHAR